MLHDRSVNKIITGARNSIKRQSRYLSVAPVRCVILPCHNQRSLSRAHQKLGQEARCCHRSGYKHAYFFLLLSDFCRSNYPRRKQLHRRMKYFSTSLSFSLFLFLLFLWERMQKNISRKRWKQRAFSECPGIFF